MAGGRVMSERVLAIGSHIDDIEIGCGGSLLKHRDAGDEIFMAILKSDEDLTAPVSVRRTEQRAACKVLAVDAHHYRMVVSKAHIEDTVSMLDRIEPTVLYFPFEKDHHQDHNYASKVGFAVSRNVSI